MKTGLRLFLLAAGLLVAGFTRGQWSTDVQVNNQMSFTGSGASVPYVVSHPSGFSYLSWFTPGSGGEYYPWIQCVDVQGYTQWAQGGIQVSTHPSMTWITDYDLAISPDTCVLIAFQDTRNSGNNNVFIYKISPSGQFVWGNDGVELSNQPDFEANPVIAVHPDNSVVVAWPRDTQPDGEIILQRLNASGQKQWGTGIVIGESGYGFTWPRVVPAGNDNTILVYYKEWGPYWAPNRAIMAQKYNAYGVAQWSVTPTLFSGVIPVYIHPLVAPDGSGGAYVVWFYERVSNHLSTFIQHVDANGNVTMENNGTEVSTSSNLHLEPALACDTTTGEAYVCWRETNSGQSQYGLSAQKMSADGTRGWGNTGKQLIGLSTKNITLLNASAMPGAAAISYLYDDFGSASQQKVRAIRINSDGSTPWSGTSKDVSTYASAKGYLAGGDYMNSQWIFGWSDGRVTGGQVFAQNLNEDGEPGPLTWDLEAFPDTLWFTDPASPWEGVPFHIRNPNSYAIDVMYVQQFGTIDYPIPLVPWYVYPQISTFPVTIGPGDTLTRLVKFVVTDNLLSSDTLAFDTLDIYTLTDTAHLIIAANPEFLYSGLQEHGKSGVVLYPNPSQGETHILFSIDQASSGEITIFDFWMRPVKQVFHGNLKEGKNHFTWDGTTSIGQQAPAGLYFISVKTSDHVLTAKILLQ